MSQREEFLPENPREQLEDALSGLLTLLEAEGQKEASYQALFEDHPVLLRTLGYSRAIPHPALPTKGSALPDFLCERAGDGLWEIFELKRPDTPVLPVGGRRLTFYKEFDTYIAQCNEYAEAFEQESVRDWFKATHGSPIQRRVPSVIVAGESEGLDRRKVNDLLSNRGAIRHLTFDDVISLLRREHSTRFGPRENLPGWSLHLVMIPWPAVWPNYLLDIGVGVTNRVTAHIDTTGLLRLSVRDRHGRTALATSPVPVEYGQMHYFVLEVGLAKNQTYLSIETNGREYADRTVDPFELELGEQPFVYGSDAFGNEYSAFDMFRCTVWQRTLNFATRRHLYKEMYGEFWAKDYSTRGRARSVGNKFMYSVGHPNFGDRRPAIFVPAKIDERSGGLWKPTA